MGYRHQLSTALILYLLINCFISNLVLVNVVILLILLALSPFSVDVVLSCTTDIS